MASSLVQIRLDDELKSEATALYDALGLDFPTAIRMFIKRSVMIGGIPFSMTLPTSEYKATKAVRSMQEISKAAQAAGVADMTLNEINAEISAARAEGERSGEAAPIEELMPDSKDVVFYEVVMEARKSESNAYLVTGNLKHSPVKPFVVTPKEMMEIVNAGEI